MKDPARLDGVMLGPTGRLNENVKLFSLGYTLSRYCQYEPSRTARHDVTLQWPDLTCYGRVMTEEMDAIRRSLACFDLVVCWTLAWMEQDVR